MTADLHEAIIRLRSATALIPLLAALRKTGSAFQEAALMWCEERATGSGK